MSIADKGTVGLIPVTRIGCTTLERLDDKRRKKKRGTIGEEISLGDLRQEVYLDGMIRGTTESTGTEWIGIRENGRGQDP